MVWLNCEFRRSNEPNSESEGSISESSNEDTDTENDEDIVGQVISQKENIEKNLRFLSGKEFGGRWSIKVSLYDWLEISWAQM